ncbi:hypothetical protein PENFLA_c060G09122 [Penicillium flavigenum]|uniref:Uncharacterized protein n=1 Tax=Penicillium flavigenum TaxID=254877 RepID=A0A1V6SFV4_9EURO|nr:hypothetical protein PENFLA_c060G09122 [Penicillium flavigenum]
MYPLEETQASARDFVSTDDHHMSILLGDVVKDTESELVRLADLHGYHTECTDSTNTANGKVDTVRESFYAKHKIPIDYQLLKATPYANTADVAVALPQSSKPAPTVSTKRPRSPQKSPSPTSTPLKKSKPGEIDESLQSSLDAIAAFDPAGKAIADNITKLGNVALAYPTIGPFGCFVAMLLLLGQEPPAMHLVWWGINGKDL